MKSTTAKLRLGVLVNPFAGVGGAVALKGSDGLTTREEALRRGAQPQAGLRMAEALRELTAYQAQLEVLTWGGAMGEQSCREAGLPARVLGQPKANSDSDDTREAVAALCAADIELLLFAGGDGTARDLVDALPMATPVLGVPAGCKMHSGVYAVNPPAAGKLLADILRGNLVELLNAEVRDIDEEAFRQGVVRAQHYGELTVPGEGRYLQQVKCGGREVEDLQATEIAAWMAELLEEDTYYLMGSGSTVAAVMAELGLDNTLLGVDVVRNGELVAADQGAAELLALIADQPARAVLTVIGGQGHLFGRGNQQFSPQLIRRLGKDNIHILASRLKLETLQGRPLLVDSGDSELDRQLSGLWPVISGYDDTLLYRVGVDAGGAETA